MPTRNGRHPTVLRPDDCVLVVIDMQEPFLRAIWERERVVSNVTRLIQAANIMRMPVVPTVQYAEKMGDTIPEIAKKLPSGCVPFDKMCFSCWGDEAFASEVHRSGRKQVLVCGIEAHVCVAQTALDLIANGYQVHVAADAVSSRTEANWQVGLNRIARSGGIITSVEAAMFELLGDSGTPEFRDMLELIK